MAVINKSLLLVVQGINTNEVLEYLKFQPAMLLGLEILWQVDDENKLYVIGENVGVGVRQI